MALITLPKAKAHLHIDPEDIDRDNDIDLKLEQASATIVGRVGSTAHWRAIAATWTEANVPLPVQAAILYLLTHLFEHPGDDMKADADLWMAIDRMICMYKDPVLA
jgi:hypothetical protein